MKIIKYKIIVKPLYHLFLKTRFFYFKLINFFILKLNEVKYLKFPYIDGILYIRNRGIIQLDKNIKFNSRLTSNFVGLFKPCTIEVRVNGKLTIGKNSGFSGVSIFCADSIKIGSNLFCGGNVVIWDSDFHSLNHVYRNFGDKEIKTRQIIIGNNVFIGANSIILKGTIIEDGAIIGAGSVVAGSVIKKNEIWAGNPAKFIKKIEN